MESVLKYPLDKYPWILSFHDIRSPSHDLMRNRRYLYYILYVPCHNSLLYLYTFRSTEQHTLEVSIFIIILYLDQDKLILRILGKHIYLSNLSSWLLSLSRSFWITIFSPGNVVSKPSSTLKFALFRSRRFIAQSKRIIWLLLLLFIFNILINTKANKMPWNSKE